jgi:uncharacterized radical SAM superfamily Fe-S cluster-containing enzyme
MTLPLRDYNYLGTTKSLCPECLGLVDAKIVERRGRVYFRKNCPTHGKREDFVCSDVRWYDRLEYSTPAKLPRSIGTEAKKGCPYDCGLCEEHEQHTCIALVELTESCNLECPMCFAASAPGGKHRSVEECKRAIDRFVEIEGHAETLQLSGGEPTIHPQFAEILDYAVAQPIDYVTINTNGIRFAKDPALLARVAAHRDRVEAFFQFDGFDDDVSRTLRGEALTDLKLRALEKLGEAGIHVTLAVTLQGGVNDDQVGRIVEFAGERPWITGINFQPATYSGRHVLPETLERRVTFPDVIQGIASQTNGLFREEDFIPLPCAHPNCHSLSFAYRSGGKLFPLMRFFDAKNNYDLLANGITFTRPRARTVALAYLGRMGCCAGGDCGGSSTNGSEATSLVSLSNGSETKPTLPFGMDPGDLDPTAIEFFSRAIGEELGARDLLRITITSFLDAYTFDIRRLMRCCTHHVLPSGHVIPFCAYNVLYRNGHVALPELTIRETTAALAAVETASS